MALRRSTTRVSVATGMVANSIDPDWMPLNVASNQDLHCLLRFVYQNV